MCQGAVPLIVGSFCTKALSVMTTKGIHCWLRALPLVVLLFSTGCVTIVKEVRKDPVEPRPHPMLAAARANQVSLFGDVQGSQTASFASRSAISLKQHTFSEIGSDYDADIDRIGKHVCFSSTRHSLQPDLYLKSVDGVAVTQLTSDPSSDIQPEFSPDGSRIAFTSNRSGNWDIWVMDVHGSQPIQVTDGVADDVHPSWSPDGTEICYSSLPPDRAQWELWIADARAGATKRFIGYGLFPEWSPIGDQILYQRARERGSRWFSIWTLNMVDGEPRYPTEIAASPNEALILPTWSPDGQQIAFTTTSTVPAESTSAPAIGEVLDVWLINADGRGRVRLTDGFTVNYAPVFAPDGRVFFTTGRAGHENIWSVLPAGPLPAGLSDEMLTSRPGSPGYPGTTSTTTVRTTAVREQP